MFNSNERFQWLWLIVVVVLAVLTPALRAERPNVVLILIDNLNNYSRNGIQDSIEVVVSGRLKRR